MKKNCLIITNILSLVSAIAAWICDFYELFGINLPKTALITLLLIIPLVSALWIIGQKWFYTFFDRIFLFLAPHISWRNDGFAYMTIEARFRDNFRKTGFTYPDADDHYSKFCQEKVLSAEDLTELFKGDHRREYITNYREKINKLLNKKKINNQDVQYLFANSSFIFAEHYFFYHILHLFSTKNEDPWAVTKDQSLSNKKIVNKINDLFDAYKKGEFDHILRLSVFANSTDLSQLECKAKSFGLGQFAINDNINNIVADYCNTLKDKQVHIIVDNCGLELISDFILGSFLIKNCQAQKVIYHYNVLPIFVSDTVDSDIKKAKEAIENIKSGNKDSVEVVDEILELLNNNERVEFRPNIFWNMPFPFKEMPNTLLDDLNGDTVGLIIVKGDLNYRRLVEDRKWNVSKKINSRVNYFEKPILILRSLKSNTLLGVDRKKAKEYDLKQPNWKIVGDYGIIQLINKK